MKQQTSSRQRTAVFPHAKAHSAVCIGDSYSCIACLMYTRDHLQPGRVSQGPSMQPRGLSLKAGTIQWRSGGLWSVEGFSFSRQEGESLPRTFLLHHARLWPSCLLLAENCQVYSSDQFSKVGGTILGLLILKNHKQAGKLSGSCLLTRPGVGGGMAILGLSTEMCSVQSANIKSVLLVWQGGVPGVLKVKWFQNEPPQRRVWALLILFIIVLIWVFFIIWNIFSNYMHDYRGEPS